MTRHYNWIEGGHDSPQSNRPLLFIHGFLGDAHDWDPIISGVTGRACWAVDLPGHGQTPISSVDTFDQILHRLIDDICHIQLQSGHRQIDLIGYSMGGRLAMHISDRCPDLIGHLIIESASPGITREAERRARTLFDAMVIQKLHQLTPTEFVDWWCAFPMFGDLNIHPDYPMLRSKRAQFDPIQTEWVYRILGSASIPSLWPKLGRLGISAYITGEFDVKYRQIAEAIQDQHPLIPIFILPKLAHNCHFEAPHTIQTIIKSVLNGSCIK